MPNTVNRGGEGWSQDNQAYRNALEAAAIHYGGAQAPQLLQVMLNMGRLETNWTGSGSMPNGGWFQISDALRNEMQDRWGTTVNRTDIGSASIALARFITEVGTGTGAFGTAYNTPRSDTINLEVGPGMWHGGIPGYTRFLTGNTTQSQDGIGPLSTRYTVQALQGAATAAELSQPLRERYERLYGVDAWPDSFGNSGIQIGTVGIGSDARHPFFPGGSSLAPEVEQRLQQGMDFLDAWAVSDPGRANVIEGLAAGPGAYPHGDFPWTTGQVSQPYGEALQYYGYMPSNLRFNAQTGNWDPTANPVSTEGPWGTAALSNWVQDTIADPNISAGQRWYVQQLGGLDEPPSNLELQAWSPWGVSGDAGHGATNWSLGVGRPGAIGSDPEVSGGGVGSGGGVNVGTLGIDVGNWLGRWVSDFFREPAGPTRGNLYDASSSFGTSGNVYDASGIRQGDSTVFQPGSNVYDASDQPMQDDPGGNIINWVPAGGGWGEAGPGGVGASTGWAELQSSGNPNNWIWNPATLNWGTFSGGGGLGSQVTDYNRWYEDVIGGRTAQPEGGINPIGPYNPDWGQDIAAAYGSSMRNTHNIPGPFGTSAVQDYGQPNVHQQIAITAAQVAAANAAQIAANNAQVQTTTFNPITGQSVNPWNPQSGINSLTGASNW